MFWIGVNEGLFVFDGQNMGFCFDNGFLSVSVLTISSMSYYLLMSIWREKKKKHSKQTDCEFWIFSNFHSICYEHAFIWICDVISQSFLHCSSWARCFLCLFHNEVLGSLMKQAWLSAHNLSEIKTTKISVHYKLMHLFFLYEYISRLFFPNS